MVAHTPHLVSSASPLTLAPPSSASAAYVLHRLYFHPNSKTWAEDMHGLYRDIHIAKFYDGKHFTSKQMEPLKNIKFSHFKTSLSFLKNKNHLQMEVLEEHSSRHQHFHNIKGEIQLLKTKCAR